MMIGEKAYQNALRRRAELRQELEDIETFLHLCERFAGDDLRLEVRESSSVAVTYPTEERGDIDESCVEVGGNALRPHIRKAILDTGRPLSRIETVRALRQRGIRVAGQDAVVNVGTVIWRAKDEFVNLKPHGYWPRNVPYAAAGYDPANASSQDADASDDGGA